MNPFAGVWNLISYTRRAPDGTVGHPYSEQPIGRLTYDTAGRMSAQLMRPGRASALPPGVSYALGQASDAEIREAVSGFVAYYGTYEIDEASATVLHHVQAALVPSWTGATLRRRYHFDGRRLTLSAEAAGVSITLVWEREP